MASLAESHRLVDVSPSKTLMMINWSTHLAFGSSLTHAGNDRIRNLYLQTGPYLMIQWNRVQPLDLALWCVETSAI